MTLSCAPKQEAYQPCHGPPSSAWNACQSEPLCPRPCPSQHPCPQGADRRAGSLGHDYPGGGPSFSHSPLPNLRVGVQASVGPALSTAVPGPAPACLQGNAESPLCAGNICQAQARGLRALFSALLSPSSPPPRRAPGQVDHSQGCFTKALGPCVCQPPPQPMGRAGHPRHPGPGHSSCSEP